jgi:adenylate cyclase class 2
MARPASPVETEIKLPLPSVEAGRRLLRDAGFSIARRRVFESNTLFDTPDGALRRGRKTLRLRTAGRRHTITFKNAPRAGRYKSREEIESDVADAGAIGTILERIGYRPVFRYDKYRTEYAKDGQHGVVTLDETPVGAFLELEGSPRWIDRTARELGYSRADYITASYVQLYLDQCKRNGIAPGHMVFTGRR